MNMSKKEMWRSIDWKYYNTLFLIQQFYGAFYEEGGWGAVWEQDPRGLPQGRRHSLTQKVNLWLLTL